MSAGLPETLTSPLAEDGALADRIETVSAALIVEAYRRQFAIDVATTFAHVATIGVYRCRATGFQFHYPFDLAGDAAFYDQLERRIPDYYDENKWEHDLAAGWVAPGARVLDIGCGRGGFLAKAAKRGGIATGLESNPVAAAAAAERGIEIVDELIEAHAARRPGHYDMVAAFQVLEHIAHPLPFLRACVACLREGGRLVLAVPNDQGFMGMDRSFVLNGPPHHLGRWDRRSLESLCGPLPLDLERVDIEPLNHPAWFQAAAEARYLPKARWLRSLWYRLGGARTLRRAIEENAAGIAGHTIMAAYRRRQS